jgi:hypothetical protein
MLPKAFSCWFTLSLVQEAKGSAPVTCTSGPRVVAWTVDANPIAQTDATKLPLASRRKNKRVVRFIIVLSLVACCRYVVSVL